MIIMYTMKTKSCITKEKRINVEYNQKNIRNNTESSTGNAKSQNEHYTTLDVRIDNYNAGIFNNNPETTIGIQERQIIRKMHM